MNATTDITAYSASTPNITKSIATISFRKTNQLRDRLKEAPISYLAMLSRKLWWYGSVMLPNITLLLQHMSAEPRNDRQWSLLSKALVTRLSRKPRLEISPTATNQHETFLLS